MDEKDTIDIIIKGNYSHVLKAPKERNRPLTDDEKAATFIGWSPTDPCVGGLQSFDGHCEHGNYGTCDQFSVAPDMTQPKNYMAALLTLDVFSISYGTKEDGWFVYLEKIGPSGFIIEQNDIVVALSLYYDKVRGE